MAAIFLNRSRKMSDAYSGSSIDASYQVSFHFGKMVPEEIVLEIDQPETRIAYDSHVC